MGRFYNLKVRQWAAIRLSGEGAELLGQAPGEDAIPGAIRRRMGQFERLAVRCTLGVLDGPPTDELIFCSRYGNMEMLGTLLLGLAEGQLISPMGFSGSVHNAAPGLTGQVRKERLSHTAIAAGRRSLAAGLIEATARLASEECRNVALTFADMRLPPPYEEFEEEQAPSLALAMRLELDDGSDAPAFALHHGRGGVLELLGALMAGPVRLAVTEALWAP
jgi:Beta-ketoacyl synthase, N-terminal domain